jgi:hypothetical protein
MRLDRPATAEEVAAIMAVVGQLLAEEATAAPAAPELDPWHVAARVEALGIVRRIPGKLDLRYMGAPTRERLSRPLKQG